MRLCFLALVLATSCSVESTALPPTDAGMDGVAADSSMGDSIVVPPDGCMPRAESCNDVDDDCDGTVDEGFDTSRDPRNCGGCGTECDPAPANGAAGCTDGACDPLCDVGFANCNGDPADGCEAVLSEPSNCGTCENVCSGATPLCESGTCVDDCGGGTMLCPPMSCVDVATDVLNCGACASPCPAPANSTRVCTGGTCSFSCDAGFDDCDGDATNGCEADLSDVATCGACGVDCARPNTVASCTSGVCGYVCQAGFGDCDGDTTNGCENTLDSLTDCGGCGVACAPVGATGDCSTGTCVPGACTPPFSDCDGDPTNACETNTSFDEMNCGACGSAVCAGYCNAGNCFTDCDGAACMPGCGSSPCMCNSGTCGFVCTEPTCDVHCQGSGIECTVLGYDSMLSARCSGGADCTFDAREGTSSTMVRCENAGTICEVDCRGATSCAVECRSGADCELRCSGGGACSFSRCDDMMADCGSGRIVCNPTGSC